MSEGRSYPEDYRTVEYRNQTYPSPGDWALNLVEADGVSWYYFEGVGADLAADVHEEPDHTVYLGLYEDVDGATYHKLSLNGTVVARIRDDLSEDQFWQVVTECLWWAVDPDLERPDPLVYADAQEAAYTTYEEAEQRRLEETASAHQTLDAFGGDSA